MMKNRAGLLALLVLVIATVLMVFFVLPHIGADKKPIGEAINQAGSEVKNTIADNTQKPTDATTKLPDAVATNQPAPADTVAKLGGLTSAATSSLTELRALFVDGKGPTADVFGAAKTKAIAALQAIVDLAVPANADPATTTLLDTAHKGAGTALSIIQTLPENIADAVAAIERAQAALLGKTDAAPQANAAPVKPTFDVLRVEPDGSAVIAGAAEPESKLEVIDGSKVINKTDVGTSGDFATVLDTPLAPGDHQIVLKSTDKNGTSAISDEVATVSIPKDGSSQLLAMVTKPGEASRIMTAPQAAQPAAPAAPATAAATPAPAPAPAPAAQPAPDAAKTNQPDTAVASASPTPAPDGTATPAPAPAATGEQPEILINAVEIENDHIFVAGATRANLKVRAYADEKPIGESTAGGDGHFVVDGPMPLAVGDHKIRVDGLDAGGKVILRAAVNFNRPEGNQLTVAAQTPAAAGTAATPSLVPFDEGQLGKLKTDATRAFTLLRSLFADSKTPSDEQLAAARSGTEFALKSLSDFRPAIDASAVLKQAAAAASEGAGKALTFLQSLPRDPKSVGAALDRLDQMIAAITKPASEPAAAAPAAAASAQTDANGTKTYVQPSFAVNNNAVIIRHGDTLWQISRRTYGLGVRYTTIYLANEDKINNPDRILPGQVFGLPKDALPNAEELHRKRLSGQHL